MENSERQVFLTVEVGTFPRRNQIEVDVFGTGPKSEVHSDLTVNLRSGSVDGDSRDVGDVGVSVCAGLKKIDVS